MIELKCNLEIPEVSGLSKNEITVGRKLELSCSGEVPSKFNFSQAQFKNEAGQENTYKLLTSKKDGQNYKLTWTVYRAGNVKIPQLILTDHNQELSLGSQDLNVISVIEQKPNESPKPFGPLFPLSIPWPVVYFVIAFVIVCGLVAWLIQSIYKQFQYRKILESFKKYDSPVDPDLQFYRSIRTSEKKAEPFSDIEHSFYIYLSRRCKLPILELSEVKAFQFHKKYAPEGKKLRSQIKKIIEEFNHVKADQNLNSKAKMSHILPKVFHFIDGVESVKGKAP